ncbi:hypothetical protein BFW38_16970 [Terasakiispira papahanaumokuakeensis]|uniref:DUF2283 domain-containing protein n=1 Tax=Terasakiispira papahanaumokuakeensis TaxID=197479 RepID=A0A1E2VDD1_9GAMM|nr:DUF2283 domain-containing protein [Terasakiispira papahanaumokuakeensis]ODC04974.1 hypothetical protein BFW38_16970 [Terasakiispira papahanaumokuakeensis]
MPQEPIQLKVSEDDDEMAYLFLPDHPKQTIPGIVKKQTRLSDLIDDYKEPGIYLDFNADDTIIGIEIT